MDLSIEKLACRRGGRLVFEGISFDLAAGRAAVVRGPNGSGKSSMLRLLAGFVPIAGGSVRLGQTSLEDRTAFQELVAYAGHLDSVKPALTVWQNLAHWAAIFGAGEKRVQEGLDFFGLGAIADRPAVQCSAGQKRRLGLARLMISDRPFWLLDEPTVSLDQAATEKVAKLVQSHVSGGGLAMIATHIDLGLAGTTELHMPESMAAKPQLETADDAFLAGDWR